METGKKPKEHNLHLEQRRKLAMTGITSVGSFDENEILLETTMGLMALKGEGLHITQLNLDAESLTVEGMIKAIMYTDGEGKRIKGKGLLERLLR